MSIYLPWLIGLLIFLLDQFSKLYISRNLFLGQSVAVVKNILHISLVHNSGVAFGLFKNQKTFFIILSLIIIFYMLRDFVLNERHYTLSKRIGLGLILGGAGGNLLDRLRLGYIVDFLDLRIWPVFNIADLSICTGAFLVSAGFLLRDRNKRR